MSGYSEEYKRRNSIARKGGSSGVRTGGGPLKRASEIYRRYPHLTATKLAKISGVSKADAKKIIAEAGS